MARKPRIDHPGAWHHVGHRGLDGRAIYLDDRDRLIFCDLLGEALDRFELETHAWCLMDNHYHLLVRSRAGLLSRAMRHVNGVDLDLADRMVASVFGAAEASLRRGGKGETNAARLAAVHLACTRAQLTQGHVAVRYGFASVRAAESAIRRAGVRRSNDRAFAQRIDQIEKRLHLG